MSNLAQRSIDKLKPMITAEEAQVKRLESLIDSAKSGSDKEKQLKGVLAASQKTLEPLMKRLHELENKQQTAISDEAKNIKKSEGTAEAI